MRKTVLCLLDTLAIPNYRAHTEEHIETTDKVCITCKVCHCILASEDINRNNVARAINPSPHYDILNLVSYCGKSN